MKKYFLITGVWLVNLLIWGGIYGFLQYKFNNLPQQHSFSLKIEPINTKNTAKDNTNLNNNLKDSSGASAKEQSQPETKSEEDRTNFNKEKSNTSPNLNSDSPENIKTNDSQQPQNPLSSSTNKQESTNPSELKEEEKNFKKYSHLQVRTYNRPKIAIMVVPMGLDMNNFLTQVAHLPSVVTVGLHPYVIDIKNVVHKIKQQSKEIWLNIPVSNPNEDNGPLSLHLNGKEENIKKLKIALNSFVEFAGCTLLTEAPLLSKEGDMEPILMEINKFGAAFMDMYGSKHGKLAQEMGIPNLCVDTVIDVQMSAEEIDEALMDLEKSAIIKGQVVALVWGLPLAMERLKIWADALNTDRVVLVPVSQLAN